MTTKTTRPELEEDIYRNSNTGARIRLRALLRQRRDEFADLPEGIRSVYVSRVCRATAAFFLAFGGALILAMGASPGFTAWLEGFAPGPRPALATTVLGITWGLGALAYFAAWALAERRFTRVMLRSVKPTEDLHDDVERLAHVTPATVAARMTNAWETTSTALPMLAASALLPATIIYLVMAVAGQGFVDVNAFELALADGTLWLSALAGLGLVAAMVAALSRRVSFHALGARRNLFVALLGLGAIAGAASLFADFYLGATLSGALAIISAFFAWSSHRVREERSIIDPRDLQDSTETSVASGLRTLRQGFVRARTAIRERGLGRAFLGGLSVARQHLAISRRLVAVVKAPLSWSVTTTAGVVAAGLVILLAGQVGASALADARTETASAATVVDPLDNVLWNGDADPVVAPTNVPVNNQPTTQILYTAAPASDGVPGTLLILDLEAGTFARTDLFIDLQYLPCGKVHEGSSFTIGQVTRLTDDQNALMLSRDGHAADFLDITSESAQGPLEIRAQDGTVFTPCTTLSGLDLQVLADDHTLALP